MSSEVLCACAFVDEHQFWIIYMQ